MLHYIYTGQVRATPPSAVTAPQTQRETWLTQLEWLLLCIHASYRYDVPRMRLLCESMYVGRWRTGFVVLLFSNIFTS